MHRDTTLYILETKVAPIFWVRITCFSLSLSFSMWILLCWCK